MKLLMDENELDELETYQLRQLDDWEVNELQAYLIRAVATIRELKEECRQWRMRWDSVLALLHDDWNAQDIRETLGI